MNIFFLLWLVLAPFHFSTTRAVDRMIAIQGDRTNPGAIPPAATPFSLGPFEMNAILFLEVFNGLNHCAIESTLF